MHFKFRNVNEVFRRLVQIFHDPNEGYGSLIIKSSSRNGPVLYVQEPVTITYTHPRERVLFNEARDANPFFHLYESLWMLAGRNDVAPLKYYVSTIDQFSDDGVTFNGAYGHRWRKANVPDSETWVPQGSEFKEVDQLKLIIEHLKAKPDSRRAVLHMSNVEDDLLKMDTSRDICCNLVVTFLIRDDVTYSPELDGQGGMVGSVRKYLDMTVFNRSNDMVWGMLGANVVHFSMLQEYMAACIGVEVGHYHQITNNLHVYEWNFKPEKWLADCLDDHECFYNNREAMSWDHLFPLVKDPATFDREVVEFVERHKNDSLAGVYEEPFLGQVAQPACIAYHHYKCKDYGDALNAAEHIRADDWRIACTDWIKRRMEKHHAKASD